MNQYSHFLRFGLTNDVATNLTPPVGIHPLLPVVAGDVLRWLVPASDLPAIPPERLQIGMRTRKTTGAGVMVGQIRRQSAEFYTEITLLVSATPTADTFRQFSIMLGDMPILGTFRGQQTDPDDYLDALADHYQGYRNALVLADRRGRELRLRVYPNPQFSLNGEKLTIGLGLVTARNTNTPTLTLQKKEVGLPAQDIYTLAAGADIANGNIFSLNGVSYTAGGNEKPADILRALGVASGTLTVGAGASVQILAQAGRQVVTNTNRPALTLLYDSTLNGSDFYKASVSPDVVSGNVYSLSATGAATRSYTAGPNDTKTTIEQYFNNTGGKAAFPAGSAVQINVYAGVLSVANTNAPTLGFSAKQSLPVRSVLRYTAYIGSSIRAGNEYVLTVNGVTRTYRAVAGDTAMNVAAGLGKTSNPFVLETLPNITVQAFARKGPAYDDSNLASVTLTGSRTVKNVDRIAEVIIPALPPGEYQFTLSDNRAPNLPGFLPVLAASNPLFLLTSAHDTVWLRYGVQEAGRVFGYGYLEDGLMQQLRVWAYVDAARLSQEESLSRTLDDQTVRGRTRAYNVRKFTTTLQPEAFHAALYQALKHPVLIVNGTPFRCEGNYQQSEPQGRRRWMQGQAELTEPEGLDYVPGDAGRLNSASGSYALIGTVTGLDGLWLSVKQLSFVQPIEPGVMLPAAEYDLFIRTGNEEIILSVGIDGKRIETFHLLANVLNRLGPIRLSPGVITLTGVVATGVSVTATAPDAYNPQDAEVNDQTIETSKRSGDFSEDFNADFNKR